MTFLGKKKSVHMSESLPIEYSSAPMPDEDSSGEPDSLSSASTKLVDMAIQSIVFKNGVCEMSKNMLERLDIQGDFYKCHA